MHQSAVQSTTTGRFAFSAASKSATLNGCHCAAAFTATGLLPTLKLLEDRKIAYDLRRLDAPEGGVDLWQLFFMDPNNAKVELDFSGKEAGPSNFRDVGTAAASSVMTPNSK